MQNITCLSEMPYSKRYLDANEVDLRAARVCGEDVEFIFKLRGARERFRFLLPYNEAHRAFVDTGEIEDTELALLEASEGKQITTDQWISLLVYDYNSISETKNKRK